VGCSAS